MKEAIVPEEEQPYKVPENWVWVKLGQIVEVNPPKIKLTDVKDDDKCSFIPMVAVSDKAGIIFAPEEREYKQVRTGYTQFIDGDVIFAKITPCMENGKSAIAEDLINGLGYGSTEFYVLRTKGLLDRELLYHLVRSSAFRAEAKRHMSGAVGQQRVPKKFIEDYLFPLPPLNEQKRIADKVGKLLDKINHAKQLIEEAKETFELRRAAILEKAFRGELTVKWREENVLEKKNHFTPISSKQKPLTNEDYPYDIPESWRWLKLGEVFKITSGGTPSRAVPQYYEGEVPWIKTGEIKWNDISDAEEKISADAIKNSSAKILPVNTVLVAMYGQGFTRGRAAILRKESACNQAVCALLPSEYVDPKFLFYYFMEGYRRFRKIAQGGNQENLSGSLISGFAFQLPPIEEQQAIVEYLEKIFEFENSIQELTSFENHIESLINSILNKSFRGELGTNDINEKSPLISREM